MLKLRQHIPVGLLLTLPVIASAACASSDKADALETAAAAASASDLTEVRSFGSNPGGLKMYEHAPTSLRASAPVVLVMHGCVQSAIDAAKTGWNALSDELGFLVVYPEQQTGNNAMRCFNWAGEYGDPANLQRAKGENLSIKEMVDKALALHGGDPKRVFVTGFSGGGGQAALVAAVWPDVFAGAATVAGIPYDCTRQFLEVSKCLSPGKDLSPAEWGKRVRDANPTYTGKYPRMSIWQGSADNIVSPSNRTQLIKQWTNVHGLSMTPTKTDTVDGHNHAVFADQNGNALVETYEVRGMSHGVPVDPSAGCGSTAQYAIDKNICAARHISDWFGLTKPAEPPPVKAPPTPVKAPPTPE
jgi:poly(hydroxyalkanoate) depolymerase family esterase